MKKILILLMGIGISFVSKAQSSSVDEIQNEFLPSMSSSQRTTLNTFESLRVIDTDDQRTWIFKNAKWQREFSDEAILQAKVAQDERLKTNVSWKQFDELSKPEGAKPAVSEISSVEKSAVNIANTSKSTFRYEVFTQKDLASNSFQIKPANTEKIAFIKVYVNDLTAIDVNGFAHFSIKEANSILVRPLGTENNHLSLSLIKTIDNVSLPIESNNVRGLLVAYISN
jgi:hypothetical protein